MKDLEDASFVIGIQIQRDRTHEILGLSQKTYIDKVLDRYGMKNCSREIIESTIMSQERYTDRANERHFICIGG